MLKILYFQIGEEWWVGIGQQDTHEGVVFCRCETEEEARQTAESAGQKLGLEVQRQETLLEDFTSPAASGQKPN